MDNNIEILKIGRNIISWYPFNYNSSILCINIKNNKLVEELKTRVKTVVQIDDLNGIDDTSILKYEYVFLYGINRNDFKIQDYLKFAKDHLIDEGTILIACDNKYGLKNLNVNVAYDEKNNYYSKYEIENELKKQGIINYKFYYPLPSYKIPNVIFTDEKLPDKESILRDLTLYDDKEIVILDERNVYKDIIREKKELFTFFANSFLIEISQKNNEIKYISFNNSRKEKYRINTIMKEKFVYKQLNNNEASKHIELIKENIRILNKLKFNILDDIVDGQIKSKIMPEKEQLDKVLINMFQNDKKDEAYSLIEKYILELKEKLLKNSSEKSVFEKYNIEISDDLDRELNYIKYGFYDLIFQNCFYVHENFYFYDQEWKEENIPLEFIIYRAIEYLSNESPVFNKGHVFEKFKITKFVEVFSKLEKYIQEEIKNEKIWNIHLQNNKTIKNIYDTQVHYSNLYILKEKENEQLKDLSEELKKENIKLNNELNIIKNSRSWKLIQKFKRKELKG